jgi:tryptophanyl-tRNA synthetase
VNKEVILTGIRANNDLHIGNYFGALLPIIDMAKNRSSEYQVNLFIPDLHSFTTPIDHSQLQSQINNNLRIFAAAGLPLDNPDIRIYRQSYIPPHSELTIILNSFTYFGEMRRMTQFKDKTQKAKVSLLKVLEGGENKEPGKKIEVNLDEKQLKKLIDIVDKSDDSIGSVGLFDYPVLMASDILLYNAKYIPVGDDQTQHLEFTRDIAERMNSEFSDLFVVPEPVAKQHEFFGKDQGLRIRDLIDPTKKMSKSDNSGKGIVFLGDNPDDAAQKIKSATTDSFTDGIKMDFDERPGVSNLVQIYSLLKPGDESIKSAQNYQELKDKVAGSVKDFLTDFQAKLTQVDKSKLLQKLESDEAAMSEIANATLLKVQKAVGLR